MLSISRSSINPATSIIFKRFAVFVKGKIIKLRLWKTSKVKPQSAVDLSEQIQFAKKNSAVFSGRDKTRLFTMVV